MITRCRSFVVLLLTALGAATGCTSASGKRAPEVGSNDFVGTWQTTSGTTSLILTIAPSGEGMLILIASGSHGIDNINWRPLPGGLVTEGRHPRFRFWRGRHPDEARVEMEPLPPPLTSEEMQRFPLAFFMSRVTSVPGSLARRQSDVPQSWMRPQLPADWDQAAGRRRDPAAR